MHIIRDRLSQLTFGEALHHQTLSMTPLLAADRREPDYLTLDEALARGELQITELSESGSVPELRLINRARQAVFLLDGEELVGAKQNRVLNLSLLAPAAATLTIPVSCVEAGRWSSMSPAFSSKGRAFYANGRARKARHVTESLRARGQRESHQGEIWQDIAAKSARMGSRSDTDAMACLYEDFDALIAQYVQAMPPQPNQVGAVFAINGAIRGLDLFDCAATLRKLLPKLVVSYALDAIESGREAANCARPGVDDFLRQIRVAESSTHPSVGEGTDVRLSASAISGGALLLQDRVVHLCAFWLPGVTQQSARRQNASRMSSAVIRRRGRMH
ncbi:ARPP-1 family domain-containing protein [Thiorhodococcus minor]|uniref:ARG and Rhodanese-Phosphatase-superfamily-associated domain-containing protein n=1 Tax=Thiorhodococcus minor TaxID=57489 RepID=A0A6M0K080_9GAMM|nr:DUF6569 family protein [Thiorhodococcus minor]NEV62343.1 hypothetical protein [Thiorhodococcus minor]